MSQSFVIRMALWSVLVIYMVCDFFVFQGPLQSELKEVFRSPTDQAKLDISRGICARVWNGPIYLSQVDRRVDEKLWRTGKTVEKISEQQKKLLRWAALDELIDEAILRIKVRANRDDVPVPDTEIDAEVIQFEKRFTTQAELDNVLKTQGIESRKELRYRLAARIQQEKYVQEKIKKAITVSKKEAKEWYDTHQNEMKISERRQVRHVFLATLDHPSEEARATLTKHLERLNNNETDFTQLAAEVSEDTASKFKGGNLGWMKRDRIYQDFAEAVFSLPKKSPTLIRTKLGWHIVEVTGIAAPVQPTYEMMKDEIVISLRDSKREAAVKQYRHQLRLLNRDKITIYKEMLK